MKEQAINKIKDEMDKHKNNLNIQRAGKFLLEYLQSNPEVSNKIMADGKTIMKSFEAMQKVAMQNRIGNCGAVPDDTGFEIILKYYGIDAASEVTGLLIPEQKIAAPTSKADDFDIRLEDLL